MNRDPHQTGKRYDRLAGVYPLLETAMFGGQLRAARREACRHVAERIDASSRILIIGDGRGHCLGHLGRDSPGSSFHLLDASGSMMRRQSRIARQLAIQAPQTTVVDLRDMTTKIASDFIVAPMVLDCFTPLELIPIASWLRRCLTGDGRLVVIDFVRRESLLHRGRLWTMHRFFAAATGLPNRRLVDWDAVLQQQGFAPERRWSHRCGVDTVIYRDSRRETNPGTTRSA